MKHGTMFIEHKSGSSLGIQEQYNLDSVNHSHDIYFKLPTMIPGIIDVFQLLKTLPRSY